MKRSLSWYGLTPEIHSARRTFRDAPPPGVLTTPTKPGGNGATALIVPGNWATNPLAKVVVAPPAPVCTTQPAGFWHCITISGRTMPISRGSPERAFAIAPTSQSPSTAFPTDPQSYFFPFPTG